MVADATGADALQVRTVFATGLTITVSTALRLYRVSAPTSLGVQHFWEWLPHRREESGMMT